MNESARIIAFYLPQFHPIPENDEWWGKGFTEWTNTAKAKPLFRGHYQPNIPADLGFYDLRLPETRIAQAEMAKEYGIEAFCYYHYWFAGKRLLERPFNEVLQSGEPDFPFCLAWANESWSGVWHGVPERILIEQTYPGLKDYQEHFYAVLKAFVDKRYLTVDGKPIFIVYHPFSIPDLNCFLETWRSLARKEGLKGLHLVAYTYDFENENWISDDHGFDAVIDANLGFAVSEISRKLIIRIKKKIMRNHIQVYPYEEIIKYLLPERRSKIDVYPTVFPNWDNSPRSGRNALIVTDSNPELFKAHMKKGIEMVSNKDYENRIILIKSWNEWAEGNYLEPDMRFGKAYLEVMRDEIYKTDKQNQDI